MEQKVDEAMVAVGDETGLKKLIGDELSDSETSDEEDSSTLIMFVQASAYSVFILHFGYNFYVVV